MIEVIQNPLLKSKMPYVMKLLRNELHAFYFKKSLVSQIVIRHIKINFNKNTQEAVFTNLENGDKVIVNYMGLSRDELLMEMTKSYYDILLEFKQLERERTLVYIYSRDG